MQKEKKTKIQDALEFTFSVVGLPHYTIRYLKVSTDQIEGGAIRHGLRKLIEYVPGTNASAGYEPGKDNKTQEMWFWKGQGSTWSNLAVSTSTDPSTTATTYTVCSSNDVGVTICMFGADIATELSVNGSKFQLDPNSLHHSLNITKFPFLRNDTQLCLKTHFEAVTRVQGLQSENDTLLDANEDGIDLSDPTESTPPPVAAWLDYVNVTGTGCSATAPVVRSAILQSEVVGDIDANITTALNKWTGEISMSLITRYVYFSFLTDCPQPSNIYWDPEMGYVQPDSTSGVSYSVPSVVLVLIAVFALYF